MAQREEFDVTNVVSGFRGFNYFWNQRLEDSALRNPDKKVTADGVYEEWYLAKVDKEEASEVNIEFSKLFENLQVRSSSEVSPTKIIATQGDPTFAGGLRNRWKRDEQSYGTWEKPRT